MYKKINEFIIYCIKRLLSFLLRILCVFPLKKNKILMINTQSYTFSDNLKYLSLYLKKKKKEQYDIFFALKDCGGSKENGIKYIRLYSLTYFFHALTSAVLVTNMGGISYLPVRKRQTVINVWHGGGPYKVTGIRANSGYWNKMGLKLNAKKTNYILSSCRYFSEQEAPGLYYCRRQIINCGTPRVDFLIQKNYMKRIRDKVFRFYDIPEGHNLVLYAPTFRGDFLDYHGVIAGEKLELDKDRLICNLRTRFGGKWMLGVRLHPRLKSFVFESDGILNMTQYPDSTELLMAADVLLTDYSSLMWDYSFTKKPIFVFAKDINEYMFKRGFYLEPEMWPYPISTTNEELEEKILAYNYDEYLKQLKDHYITAGSYERGRACKVIENIINKHICRV